jgi:hypothetical protein
MSNLLDPAGRPLGPSTANLEQRIRAIEAGLGIIVGRINDQFNQSLHLAIFMDWTAQKLTEFGINLDLQGEYQAFFKQKVQDLQRAYEEQKPTELDLSDT